VAHGIYSRAFSPIHLAFILPSGPSNMNRETRACKLALVPWISRAGDIFQYALITFDSSLYSCAFFYYYKSPIIFKKKRRRKKKKKKRNGFRQLFSI
jgi:hypothetical protein